MNSYENGTNGPYLNVQLMALQELHRAWQRTPAGEPSTPGGRRWLIGALFLAACALPLVAGVVQGLVF